MNMTIFMIVLCIIGFGIVLTAIKIEEHYAKKEVDEINEQLKLWEEDELE